MKELTAYILAAISWALFTAGVSVFISGKSGGNVQL